MENYILYYHFNTLCPIFKNAVCVFYKQFRIFIDNIFVYTGWSIEWSSAIIFQDTFAIFRQNLSKAAVFTDILSF